VRVLILGTCVYLRYQMFFARRASGQYSADGQNTSKEAERKEKKEKRERKERGRGRKKENSTYLKLNGTPEVCTHTAYKFMSHVCVYTCHTIVFRQLSDALFEPVNELPYTVGLFSRR
jgi:hypothetical protein